MSQKVIFITGAARRIGKEMARHLHQLGHNLIVHFRQSESEAIALINELNAQRADSAHSMKADLDTCNYQALIDHAAGIYGELDVLINNASSYFPSEIGNVDQDHWDSLINSNLKAPFFLSQAAIPYLKINNGCIINLCDVDAIRPISDYSVYCMAKAGLIMQTKTLAKELAPDIRVNGIAPGLIEWPENESEIDEQTKEAIINTTPLKRKGSGTDVAQAAAYLIEANYTTGHILTVDGGRLLRT